MTNTELLQKAYQHSSELVALSVKTMRSAIEELEYANMTIDDIKTWENIRDLKLRHADIEWVAKQLMSIKFIEKPEDGSGTITT